MKERIRRLKKIAILGANGYIGRNITYMVKRDYPDYDLLLYGREAESVDHYGHYRPVDMADRDSVKKIDLTCDIVFMLVGKIGSTNGFDDYDSFIDINERALLNLLSEYRHQKSDARIIFPSTRLVYKGKTEAQNEESEKELKTVYAINKYACEQYLAQFHRIYGIQYTVFRVCIPYGTLVSEAFSYGTAEFMLKKATKGQNITLYGDGSQRRTLTYMEDLCETLIKGAIHEKCANDVFNIGGEDYSLKEMALLIAKKYGVGVEFVTWPDIALKIESGDTVFDSTKLDNLIGNCRKKKFADWVEEIPSGKGKISFDYQ